MNFDEDEQIFVEIGMENMILVNMYYFVSELFMLFLRRDKWIFVKGVIVDEVEREIWFQYIIDIDVCVIELKNLNGI